MELSKPKSQDNYLGNYWTGSQLLLRNNSAFEQILTLTKNLIKKGLPIYGRPFLCLLLLHKPRQVWKLYALVE